jgi:hypothetical protein
MNIEQRYRLKEVIDSSRHNMRCGDLMNPFSLGARWKSLLFKNVVVQSVVGCISG